MNTATKIYTQIAFSSLFLCAVFQQVQAQGLSHGLGNEEENSESITQRVLGLEKKCEAFQMYLNSRFEYDQDFDAYGNGGRLKARNLRPEVLGTMGKWSYRLRLNLLADQTPQEYDNLNNVIDMAFVNYKANNHWDFTFGAKMLSYGTFEFDWNPLYVLAFSEFQDNLYNFREMGIMANYSLNHNHSFSFEVANNDHLRFSERHPALQSIYEECRVPLQFSALWMGKLFDNHLQTMWSYTHQNHAKKCNSQLIMLGTAWRDRLFDIVLDYNCAFGDVDYLGLVQRDLEKYQPAMSPISHTAYNQIGFDIEYRPSKRWLCFTKFSTNFSHSDTHSIFEHYRTAYDYMAAVQYLPETVGQDIRFSLAYIGKSVRYKENLGFSNSNSSSIALSVICRLKLF
ncbi:MAG: porin [Bacteroidales bacterium]|nr:porin [Bacteroidales bacterium]